MFCIGHVWFWIDSFDLFTRVLQCYMSDTEAVIWPPSVPMKKSCVYILIRVRFRARFYVYVYIKSCSILFSVYTGPRLLFASAFPVQSIYFIWRPLSTAFRVYKHSLIVKYMEWPIPNLHRTQPSRHNPWDGRPLLQWLALPLRPFYS